MTTPTPTSSDAGASVTSLPAEVPGYDAGLHWLAIFTCAATLPLIFMGGEVTTRGAGLAVPDWPTSYGYNMFLFPYSKWVGGIFFEHTHRLAGVLVGTLSIAVAVRAWIYERRRSVRWMALALLAAVILQGLLGGLRVVWRQLDLAIVHACVAQAFLCFAGLLATATSRWWIAVGNASPGTLDLARHPEGRRLIRIAAITVALIYIQLILGALVRHHGAGLAIPDFPFVYGSLLPPLSEAAFNQINQWRVTQADLNFQPVTLGQIWLHFAHRVGALLVAGSAAHLVIDTLRNHRDQPLLARPARIIAVLIVLQIVLGVLVVEMRRPFEITSLHVVVGALSLLTAFILLARAVYLRSHMALSWRPSPVSPPASALPTIPRPATA